MEAKDAILSEQQLKDKTDKDIVVGILKKALEAQASVSYKAGIKEVVEWIKSHQLIQPNDDSITRFEPFYQIRQVELKKLEV